MYIHMSVQTVTLQSIRMCVTETNECSKQKDSCFNVTTQSGLTKVKNRLMSNTKITFWYKVFKIIPILIQH